jgi:hypothetical protein
MREINPATSNEKINKLTNTPREKRKTLWMSK